MYIFRYTILIIFGLSAGLTTAAAFVAFIAMLGIFPKYAAKTGTGRNCIAYESCLMYGILTAVLIQFFLSYDTMGVKSPAIPTFIIGATILGAIGLFGGIYIGFLIGGLSEVLNTLPIFARKTQTANKLPYIIYALALGNAFFNIFQAVLIGG